MPELPEVETITRQLRQGLIGKTITSIDIFHSKSFVGDPNELADKTISSIARRAKTMFVAFANQKVLVLIHLKMTGQLIFVPSKKATSQKRISGGHPTQDWIEQLPSKHSRVRFTFTDGSALYFNDQRLFGWVKVKTHEEAQALINTLPPDVVDAAFTPEYLALALAKSARAVKQVILDQAKMGGMGNIYANDALWLAKINPIKPAQKLSKKDVIALHQAMQSVINRGIELGGASESTYKHINGLGGSYQEEFLIYKKDGEQCTRCGMVIEKFKLGGRGTYWCRECQELSHS